MFHVFRPVMPTVLTLYRLSGGLRPAGFALVGVLVGCFRASLGLVIDCSWGQFAVSCVWSWVSLRLVIGRSWLVVVSMCVRCFRASLGLVGDGLLGYVGGHSPSGRSSDPSAGRLSGET